MGRRRILVVATTAEGTSHAVEIACRDASANGSRVMVLVPEIWSHLVDAVDQYRAVAARRGTALGVVVCVCGRPQEILNGMHVDGASVVVGGRRRAWWPTREERLARGFVRNGHDVTFAEITPSAEL
jgi:hypothetical protein